MKYLSYQGDNSPELQDRILKYFTNTDIQNGIEYGRRGFFASILSEILDFILTGLFVFTPLSKRLENYLATKTKDRFYLTVVLFFLVFAFAKAVLSLPFNYYFGFVLEHQFGFSKMSFLDWVIRTSKTLVLTIGIGILLGTLAVFVLKQFRKTWKIIIPVGSLLLSLLFTILFPILITPLFYDYKPIEEGSLKNKIVALCDLAKIKVENVYVINESKYSGHTNAYFTGFGDNRKIFLYDTLIQNHTEEEVVSVLGHEIGHWSHNHQLKDITLSTIETALLCFLLGYIFIKTKEENKIHLNEIHSPSTVPFLFLLLSILSSFSSPVWNSLSRFQEKEADWEALVLTKDKKSFISTEIKMAKDNKSRLNPNPWTVFFYHSHPTTLERIRMAEEF
ncbi:M48 family metallopeptidase [Leptospira sp. 'Mane']